MLLRKKAILAFSLLATLFVTSAAQAQAVYFVGGGGDDGVGGSVDGFAQFPHDEFVLEHLLDRGLDVFYQSGDNSTTQFAQGFDLLVISATLGSGSVRSKFHTISTPVLQWEEALMDARDGNFPITVADGDAANGTDARAREINITNNEHPITQGFPLGLVEIARVDADQDIAMPYASNIVDEVTSLAIHPDSSFDPVRHVLTAVEAGVEWADNTDAPMSVVNFPIQDHDFGNLNEIGLLLFDNSIDWLLDITPPGLDCDFNGDEVCDIVDIDELLNNIGSDVSKYDLNASGGNIDLLDRDAWLSGASNAPIELRAGDTDLDGDVDAGDLNNLGVAWQSTDNPGWGQGDFNGDDIVAAADLNDLGVSWLHGTAPAAAAVPEPHAEALLLMSLMSLVGLRRRS